MASVNIQELIKVMTKHHAVRANVAEAGGSYFESAENVRNPIKISAEQFREIMASVRAMGRRQIGDLWFVDTPYGVWQAKASGFGPQSLSIERAREPEAAIEFESTPAVPAAAAVPDLPPMATVVDDAQGHFPTAAPASSSSSSPWSGLGATDSLGSMDSTNTSSSSSSSSSSSPSSSATPSSSFSSSSPSSPSSSSTPSSPSYASSPSSSLEVPGLSHDATPAQRYHDDVAENHFQASSPPQVAAPSYSNFDSAPPPPTPPYTPSPAYAPTPAYAAPAAPAKRVASNTAPYYSAGFRNLPPIPTHLDPSGASGRRWAAWAGLGLGVGIAILLAVLLRFTAPTSMLGKMFSLSPTLLVPALILGAFFWGMFICHHRYRRQKFLRQFANGGIVAQAIAMLQNGGVSSLSGALSQSPAAASASPELRRIEAVVNQWQVSPGMDDADILLSEHASRDARELDSAWGLPRILIWALPVLGLIGTVIGISFAVGDFASFLGSDISDIGLIKQNLVGVTGGLSFSFLITLLGLASSLLLMLCVSSLQALERRAIGEVERAVVDRFLPALQAAAPVPAPDRGNVEQLGQELGQRLMRIQMDLAEQLRTSLVAEGREVISAIAQGMDSITARLGGSVEANSRAADAVVDLTRTASQDWNAPIEAAGTKVIQSFHQAVAVLNQNLQERFEQHADSLGATTKAQQDAVEASARTINELAQSTKSAGELITTLRDSVTALGTGSIPETLQLLKGSMEEFAKSQERTATTISDLFKHTDAILKSHALLMDATRKLDGIGLPAAMRSVHEGIQGIAPILASFRQPMVLQFAPAPAKGGNDGIPHAHANTHPSTHSHANPHADPVVLSLDEEAAN